MKTTFILTLLCASALTAGATLVSFPLNSMFNGALYGKTFIINSTPDFLADTNNSSFYIGHSIQVTPSGGTNPVVALEPNYYSVTFPDSGFNMIISVPSSGATLSAWNLIPTNAPVPSITPIVPNQPFTFLTIPTNMLVVGYSGPFATYQGTNLFLAVVSTNGFAH